LVVFMGDRWWDSLDVVLIIISNNYVLINITNTTIFSPACTNFNKV